MGHIVALIFLFIGFMFGKFVLNQSTENYDRNLLILAGVFMIIGSKTAVFKTIGFEIMLSNTISTFLLGVVVRRYINNCWYKKTN